MPEGRLPPEGAISLDDLAAGAAELGVTLDPTQVTRLGVFAGLLLRWNRVHNLTAIERPDQVVSHHLLDSLAIVPTLEQLAQGRELRVLDVGAGGGLPGIPLAIALTGPRFTLLDKVAKKAAFLQQAKLELGLANVEIVQARVEDYRTAPFDVIVARAFSSLADLVRLTRPLLSPTGRWCAMKGALPSREIGELDDLRLSVRVMRTVKLRVPHLDAERHLVLIEPL
jgi:16S rRNA (guanine527-N7)-methyltransferase